VIFAEPPPSLRVEGPLHVVVARLEQALESEARFAWEAPEAALALTSDGRLAAGEEYEPSPMEAAGLRALLIRFNESFPRAFPLLSGLSAPTVAAVWREAYRPGEGRVLVCERHAPGAGSAVMQVYPAGWPAEFTVGAVARAVLDAAGPDHPATLTYDAGSSALRLEVRRLTHDLVVTATDVYGEPAPAVEVLGKDGRRLPTTSTGPRPRRRPGTGGVTIIENLQDAVRAAAGGAR
jgi:hypothetical protein